MIRSTGVEKASDKNPTSIHDKNSQQTRNIEVPQLDF